MESSGLTHPSKQSKNTRAFGLPLLLLKLLFQGISASHSVVETLPGFEGKLPFKLETGYVGVGEDEDVQLFYYFTESERNLKKDPLVLWLTGGPGCSGLSAILYEIGPFTFNYKEYDGGSLPTLVLNPYSWTKLANIIFIDAPVGTGYSYARNATSYNITDTIAVGQNYEFLKKWLLQHPEFISNQLYISGDSYSGKIVPMLVEHVLNGNNHHEVPVINLQGFSIGNPLTTYEADENSRVEYAYRVGLLSTELYKSVRESCHGQYINVNTSNAQCVDDLKIVKECLSPLDFANILEPECPLISPASNKTKFDRRFVIEEYYDDFSLPLPFRTPELWCRVYNYVLSYVWANDYIVQEALHVRKGTKATWARCNKTLSYTEDVSSSFGYQVNLTKTLCRALVYSGDHDMLIPYVGTLQWVTALNLTVETDWRPWFVDGQVAGYTTKYEKFPYYLTYTTILGAGHTAPEYNPKECFAMMYRWFARYEL